MIYIERTISIIDNSAEIEEPVILYKGDSNIEVQFIINNNPFKYKTGVEQTYGQLVIKRPKTDPIFSEVAKLSSSKVLFVITGEMIDEFEELGDYDFQIRLLNSDLSSRATLPPVSAGITIKEPLCEEGVNTAPVNYSRTSFAREIADTFDEEGNYNKTDWGNGDIITDKKLNKIEDALYEINDSTPTAVSQLDNDAGYLTEHQSLDGLATETYVEERATGLQQGIELLTSDVGIIIDTYATKEEVPTVPTDVSAFTNDAGYLTEHQSLEDYALKTDIPSTDGLATKDELQTALGDIESLLGNI